MDGFNTTERFIEIPWCLIRRRTANTVLDVGYVNADMNYLQGLAAQQIPDLYGLDIATPVNHSCTLPDGTVKPLLKPVQSDIRNTPFADDFFDLIFLISTIEHVGMDNSVYKPGMEDRPATCGDFDAIAEMCRITKPGGRLLVTVPFGKYQNHGWFQQYDIARLMRLFNSTDYSVNEMQFFAYKNGWTECFPHDLKETCYQDNAAVNAAGLACLELIKRV